MEQKYVRVPFDLQLAKEITNGTKEGRIVTRGGYGVRILCFDRKTDMYPIISLVDVKKQESVEFHDLNGRWGDDGDDYFDLMLEIPEYMTFKDGDVYKTSSGSIAIYNGNYDAIMNITPYYVGLIIDDDKLVFQSEECGFGILDECTLDVTSEEKQKLIDALKQSDDPRAKECLKKIGIEEEHKCNFKPFDKVVVRENDSCRWGIDFFMAYKEGFEPYRCMTGSWGECLPFNEETENLIMTTKSYNGK